MIIKNEKSKKKTLKGSQAASHSRWHGAPFIFAPKKPHFTTIDSHLMCVADVDNDANESKAGYARHGDR